MKFEQAFKNFKNKFTDVDITGLDNLALQITLSDDDCGGTFYAELKDGVLSIEPYDYKDNNAMVDVTRDALNKLIDGKLSLEDALENGDLTVNGELEKLHGLIDAVCASVKAAKEKAAAEKAAKEAAEKAAKEAAEKKAAAEKAAKEAAEKAAAEKAKKAAEEKAAAEKAAKEAAAKKAAATKTAAKPAAAPAPKAAPAAKKTTRKTK